MKIRALGAAALLLSAASIGPATAFDGTTGYVDLWVGGGPGSEIQGYDLSSPDEEGSWQRGDLAGAARLAVKLDPTLLLQLDAWMDGWGGHSIWNGSPYDFSGSAGGVAGHLAYQLEDGATIGGMLSIGHAEEDGMGATWLTAALEGTADFDMLQVYAQAGVAVTSGERAPYVQGVLTYYVDDNLAISGHAGLRGWMYDMGGSSTEGTIGGKVEYKLADMPFILHAGVQGWSWSGSDAGSWQWQGHSAGINVGIRFPFGEETATLRELNSAVPYRDMNGVYGDQP